MNKLLTAALAGMLSATAVSSALASSDTDHVGREKCYGIAKEGMNDCASATGKHSCANKSTVSKDAGDFRYASKGECAALGGSNTAPVAPAAAPTTTN